MHFNDQLKKGFFKFPTLNTFFTFLILVKITCINSGKSNVKTNKLDDKNEILNKMAFNIIDSTIKQPPNLSDNKKMSLFIGRLEKTGTEMACNSKLIQSNVQARMRTLKSVLSTCDGYCRIAIDQNGVIYGDKKFSLESKTLTLLFIDALLNVVGNLLNFELNKETNFRKNNF
jgi:hypothetical protein